MSPFDSDHIDIHNEAKRHTFVLSLFSIVGLTLTGALGGLALSNADYSLGASLLVACFCFAGAQIYQRRTGNTTLTSLVVAYSLYSLMVYLVLAGGVENTGPLWIFLVPPVALFIRGLKQGLIEIAIFLALITLILFYPQSLLANDLYSPEFKLRLLLSFLTVTFLSACYEYSREKSHEYTLKLSQQYEQLSLMDPLTELANRRGAFKKLEFEQPSIKRHKTPLSIIACDVDHFKKINDEFGHSGGDAVLIELARIFNELIRGQDMVARWGGEEFLFILPQTTLSQAAIVADKIHTALRQRSILFNGNQIQVTVSMGIAQLDHQRDIDEAIDTADESLYQAKNAGRNQTYPQLRASA